MDTTPMVDTLLKLAGVHPEEARRALDRLEGLEKNKPTAGQVARYSALGAAAGPAMGVIRNVIEGGKKWHDFGKNPLRGALGAAATGAITSGAIPLVRNDLDRRAELGKLKAFMAQHQEPKTASAFKHVRTVAKSLIDAPDYPKGNAVGAVVGKASDFSRAHKKEGSLRTFLATLQQLQGN